MAEDPPRLSEEPDQSAGGPVMSIALRDPEHIHGPLPVKIHAVDLLCIRGLTHQNVININPCFRISRDIEGINRPGCFLLELYGHAVDPCGRIKIHRQ